MRFDAVELQRFFRATSVALTIVVGAFAAGSARAQTSPYNSLTLEWVAPGDDGTTGQVSGYEVRYSTTPDPENDAPLSQRITIGPPLAASGQTDSYIVTGLTAGTHYYFVLRAFDDGFNFSNFSNVADDTTWTCTAPSAVPTLTAVASLGQVDVAWGTTSDPLAQSLHLYRAVGPNGGFSQIQSLPVGTTTYTDTNVNAGVIYRYRAAYAGAACEGSVSASTAPVTVPSPTPPPGAAAAAPSTIHVYPNPAATSLRVVVDNQAASPMPVYLRLFDMSGHWVATVANATYPPGTSEVPWNRVGRDGRSVGAGYYELLGTVGITKVRERLVLLP